jgi:hypothetical protein
VRANFSTTHKLPYKICMKYDTFEKFALTLQYSINIESIPLIYLSTDPKPDKSNKNELNKNNK